MNNYYVYIMSSETETLYIWLTSDLVKRVYEHKTWFFEWFSKKYGCKNLVYYEIFEDINEAIKREKQLKKWKRERKINLISEKNISFSDLYENIL